MTEIKLYKIPRKAIKVLLIAIVAVAIGFFIISREPTGSFIYIVGWFNILFFGLGIAVGIFQMIDRRPQIKISEDGIWDRTTKQERINWQQIKHAYPLDIFKQKFVSLDLDDSFKLKKKPYKWASTINKKAGAQNVNLQVSQLNIDEVTLANFINEIAQTEQENWLFRSDHATHFGFLCHFESTVICVKNIISTSLFLMILLRDLSCEKS
jgi:hypothetical protein